MSNVINGSYDMMTKVTFVVSASLFPGEIITGVNPRNKLADVSCHSSG